MAEKINSLQFDDIAVEDEFRALIEARLLEDDVYSIFNKDVQFLPVDATVKKETKFPVVTFEIIPGTPYALTQEDIQIQKNTSFTAEINVYTSGEDRRRNNRQLCNILIALLQSNGKLDTYYNRGLVLRENSELSYDISQVNRRVVRMTGLCDNDRKLILSVI